MRYLIWSFQHESWWRPFSSGYTTDIKLAWKYEAEEAMHILCNCEIGHEKLVREEDVRANPEAVERRLKVEGRSYKDAAAR